LTVCSRFLKILKMTIQRLPNDCIYDILKYLKSHRSTLYNCSLVNRFWCREAIPLLYANPFHNLTNKKNYSIILTFILCFNKEEILLLKNKFKQNFVISKINIKDNYKPLFKYIEYLETFNYKDLNLIIFKWFKYYLSLSNYVRTEDYKKFIPIFHSSLLAQRSNIKKLNILLLDNFYNIRHNPNFISNLTRLNSLNLEIIDNQISQQFLKIITNLYTNLTSLGIALKPKCNSFSNINYFKDNTKQKLCMFIRKQVNLKLLKLSHGEILLYNFLFSLEYHSLVYIEFENIYFSHFYIFDKLIKFSNLKYLKFVNCYNMLQNQIFETLKLASFELKELMFIDNNEIITINMIKYLGASLQRLLLKGNNLTTYILENLSTYCSNLITLEIDTLNHKQMYNRNMFAFYGVNDYEIKTSVNLPTSVKEISLYFNYLYHSFISYGEFLDNCHVGLEIINLSLSNSFIPLKGILNYIKRSNNSLKFLGIMGSYNDLNDKELKLLDRIKAEGVKVDFFCKIRNYDDDIII
jgi:hypothetical protein